MPGKAVQCRYIEIKGTTINLIQCQSDPRPILSPYVQDQLRPQIMWSIPVDMQPDMHLFLRQSTGKLGSGPHGPHQRVA